MPLKSLSAAATSATTTISLLESAAPEGILELGYCTWQPASKLDVAVAPNTTRLLLILDGILECVTEHTEARVLPREFLRLDGSVHARLSNLSQSDSLTALDLRLAQYGGSMPLETHQCYFSEDERENKLCVAATPDGDHRRLTLNAPFEVLITKLGRYDTVVLENPQNRPHIVLVLRGLASINTVSTEEHAPALVSQESTLTITGLRRCEVVAIRPRVSDQAITDT